MCELIPVISSDTEEYGPEYGYFCEACGEYVDEPCEDYYQEEDGAD